MIFVPELQRNKYEIDSNHLKYIFELEFVLACFENSRYNTFILKIIRKLSKKPLSSLVLRLHQTFRRVLKKNIFNIFYRYF